MGRAGGVLSSPGPAPLRTLCFLSAGCCFYPLLSRCPPSSRPKYNYLQSWGPPGMPLSHCRSKPQEAKGWASPQQGCSSHMACGRASSSLPHPPPPPSYHQALSTGTSWAQHSRGVEGSGSPLLMRNDVFELPGLTPGSRGLEQGRFSPSAPPGPLKNPPKGWKEAGR